MGLKYSRYIICMRIMCLEQYILCVHCVSTCTLRLVGIESQCCNGFTFLMNVAIC